MKISKTSIDELNAVVRIIIEKQDYEATVNEKLKEHKRKANMPGFRKGMVPANLIRRMYGKSVLAEEVNQILGRELTKYISDEKLNILGEPLPSKNEPANIDFDNDEDFEFVFDLGLSPEIVVDFEKVGKIPYYEIDLDDELVDSQIKGYANRFGKSVPAEQVGENETAIGDLVQLDENENILEGGISANNVQLSVQLIRNEKIKAQFLGAKVGEVIKFNPKAAFENDQEVAHLLKIKQEEVDTLSAEFSFTINKINTFILAEVNEELIKKVYGEETEIKTIDDFRERIADELKANLKYSSEYRFLIDVKEKLTKHVSMPLPEEFLKRWLAETNKKVTTEQIEQEFGNFRKDLEWSLIKSKLFREYDLKVDEDDIRAMASEMAMMQFRQYGMYNVPAEYLDNYTNSILKNDDERHRMTEKKVEDKVLEIIKEKADIKNIQVTQKEFDDLFEK
jgi:trigger factor